MNSPPWLWQLEDWPHFLWDENLVSRTICRVDYSRGEITAMGKNLDSKLTRKALLEVLLKQAIATSAIEGEVVNQDSLRKSLARRLEIPGAVERPMDSQTEGLADVMLQTCTPSVFPINHETLHGWHRALFPTGWSAMRRVNVGMYRACAADITDPDEKKVFYSAPGHENLMREMDAFISWFNEPPEDLHPLIYSAISHLWFVSIHPYEDGNGRLARALADLALTRQEQVRLYATAPVMAQKNSGYYEALQKTNHSLDITPWIINYVQCVNQAIKHAHDIIDHTLRIASFWRKYSDQGLNERQIKVVKKLLDAGPEGYEGDMKNKKYCAITGCSNKTAADELKALERIGVLIKHGAGRSTAYALDWDSLTGSREKPI